MPNGHLYQVVEFSCCVFPVAFRCYWVHSLNTVGSLQHCNRGVDPTLFTPTHSPPSELWPWALDFCIHSPLMPLTRGFLNSVGTVSRDNSGLRPNWTCTVPDQRCLHCQRVEACQMCLCKAEFGVNSFSPYLTTATTQFEGFLVKGCSSNWQKIYILSA